MNKNEATGSRKEFEMTMTKRFFDYEEDEDLVAVFNGRGSDFFGFIPQICNVCNKTANVVDYGTGWSCPCGGDHRLVEIDEKDLYRRRTESLHEYPDHGPSRERIEKAIAVARGSTISA